MSRTWKNLAIVGFLALQLLLPVRGLTRSSMETHGSFSWNMYSSLYTCRAVYLHVDAEGQLQRIDPRRYFRRPRKQSFAFHRDTLPVFHRWLCDRLEVNPGEGRLVGNVTCSENRGPGIPLVRADVDLCSAANHGVLRSGTVDE